MSDDIHEAAARWHLAQRHDDMDWEGFARWLEADPAHRHAYDDIALLDERIERALPHVVDPAVVAEPRKRSWAGVAGAALAAAAAIAVTVGISQRPPESAPPARYAAAIGSTRVAEVADGVTATLASGSVLEASEAGAAHYRLRGSAYFSVRHDPARPVTIEIGGYRIRDLGTRFALSEGEGVVHASVEEGRISLQPPGSTQAATIAAGQEIIATRDGGLERRAIGPSGVASWRSGRFSYESVPLALVTADVARFTGRRIMLSREAAGRRFSGVLAAGDGDAMIAALEQLTGLHAHRDGQTIRLDDRAGG